MSCEVILMKDNDVLLSIIIPMYNAEKYICRCINSLYAYHVDQIEIIIIDDASTDNSAQLVKEIQEKKENIYLLSNDECKGAGYSRNKGIRLAKGRYIQFVDADDEISDINWQGLLEEAVCKDLDVVMFDNYRVTNGNIVENPIMNEEFDRIVSGKELFDCIMEKSNMRHSACIYLIRRGYLEDINLEFIEGIINEDSIFTLKMFLSASKVRYFHGVYGYKYHNNFESVTYRETNNFCISGWIIFSKLLEMVIISDTEDLPKYIYKYLNFYYGLLLDRCKKTDISIIESELEKHNIKAFQIFKSLLTKEKVSILSEEQRELLKKYDKVIIFGISTKGINLAKEINLLDDINFIGFAVSDEYWNVPNRKNYMLGHCVKKIDDYVSDSLNIIIVTAVSVKNKESVEKLIESKGFRNYLHL